MAAYIIKKHNFNSVLHGGCTLQPYASSFIFLMHKNSWTLKQNRSTLVSKCLHSYCTYYYEAQNQCEKMISSTWKILQKIWIWNLITVNYFHSNVCHILTGSEPRVRDSWTYSWVYKERRPYRNIHTDFRPNFLYLSFTHVNVTIQHV